MNSVFGYHQHPLYPQPAFAPHAHSSLNFRRYGERDANLQVQPQAPLTNKASSEDVKLEIRQQPKEALITAEGKEKARKPVDPPPIIQCHIPHNVDPGQHFLQSPYLFMCASLHRCKDEADDDLANNALAGSLVSSLHRLKDHNNKDGGFFVFGDISIKVQGTFRLKFSLFDLHKETNEVQFLTSIYTEPFRVLAAKDFKGMEESTYLSRAFSDQGVRLRLRKEPRALMSGSKRPYYQRDEPATSAAPRSDEYSYHETSNKRFRPDTEDRKDTFSNNPGVSEASYPTSYTGSSQYPSRQSSLPYSMSQYNQPYASVPTTTTSASSYQLQGGLPHPSNYLTSPLLPSSSSSSGVLQSPQHHRFTQPVDYTQMYPSSYNQQRSTQASSFSFGDDSSGLGGYRQTLGTAFGDEHRPASGTGLTTSSLGLMNQAQHTSQRSHDALGSSRNTSFSQSPETLRSGAYPHMGDTRSVSQYDTNQDVQSSGRLDDQSGISSVYSNSRNAYQGSMSDPNLTSHTDTGVLLPPSIPYTPDLSHTTVPHSSDSVG